MSNTLLLGERRLNAEMAGVVCMGDDDQSYVIGYGFDTGRWGCYPPGPDFREQEDPNVIGHVVERGGFGSSHRDYYNAAMCDGSVRPLWYYIDFKTFKNLSNRQDGNDVGDLD